MYAHVFTVTAVLLLGASNLAIAGTYISYTKIDHGLGTDHNLQLLLRDRLI
jgi:hypothetical protein